MQFKPAMAKAILEGRKTVTRRPADVYDRRWGEAGDYNWVERKGREIYRKGGSYAIQPGRGAKGVARIQIDHIDLAYLKEMTVEDARLEGFADLDGFRRMWRVMYSRWDPDELVYVITFRLLAPLPAGPKGVA